MGKIVCLVVSVMILVCLAKTAAADLEITRIEPVFTGETLGFGEFSVKAEVKNTSGNRAMISVACLYIGLTHPGVYYKGEPQVRKQYKQISIEPYATISIVFDDKFITYHPETAGELIISIVGTEVVRSYPLQFRFPPGSND